MTTKSSAELVNGFSDKVTLNDPSSANPSFASYQNKLFLAWKALGNDKLNTIFSVNGGRRFIDKYTSRETSQSAPALISTGSLLFIAWTDVGNGQLNVARIHFVQSESIVTGFSNKVTLNEASCASPALSYYRDTLFLAWKAPSNDTLNIIYSVDAGRNFIGKYTSAEASQSAPALLSHGDALFVAWTGVSNSQLNVARILFSQNGAAIEGFTNKITLNDTSANGPAFGSYGNKLFLAWKGLATDNLNVIYSVDGGRSFFGKYTSPETSQFSPALVSHGDRLFIAWTGVDNDQLNVAEVVS